MDSLNVEAVARQAMLGTTTTGGPIESTPTAPTNPPPPAKVPDPPAAPPAPEPKPTEVPKVTEAHAAAAPAPVKPLPVPSMASIKSFVGHTTFRLVTVYLVAFMMLVAINPPFVQVRSKKKRNALEAAPCSYGRAMTAAAFITVIVGLIPLVLENKDRISAVAAKMKSMVRK